MTSLRCYGNFDLDRLHRTRNWSITSENVDINLQLEGVTIEKSNQATLSVTLLLVLKPSFIDGMFFFLFAKFHSAIVCDSIDKTLSEFTCICLLCRLFIAS